MHGFKETLRLCLWAIAISTTLLAAFTLVLAHPLVQILLQRGAFTAANTNQTADALRGFTIGLTPMGFGFILSRAFGALRKNSVTMGVAIFSVFANAIFDSILARFWQSTGIALATSAVYFCTMFILLFTLRRVIGKLHLFAIPQEIVTVIQQGMRKLGTSRYYPWLRNRRRLLFPPDTFYRLRQQMIRIVFIISIFAIGIFGVFVNPLYTLRIALGSAVILLLLRYRYVLLCVWVLYPVVIRANPVLSGSNVLTGLIVPTLLLMISIPINRRLNVCLP